MMKQSGERNWEKMKRQFNSRTMSLNQIDGLKQKMEQAKFEKRRKNRRRQVRNWGAVAAAVVVFIALPNTSVGVAHAMSSIPVVGKLVDVVTFRNYQYEGDRNMANVQVPALTADDTFEKLTKTTEEINEEVAKISNQLIREFEENMKNQEGYQDVVVSSEVLNTTDRYFTLKLICYQGAGSGAEWDYFYTIDLETGERLALKDLFLDGVDYITPISEEIKRQMKEQMKQDENIKYWLDDEEVPEWNFQAITDETSFYINSDGNIVIAFDEGDVAPMYMGTVEFEIPKEVVASILR